MQMIPRGPPCVAYVANDLPGLHLLAGGDADAGAMGVQCFQSAAVVNLDTIGGSKTPLDVRRPRYLMALGGKRYAKDLESCARIGKIEMYYDYYRSEMFTQMFYRKTGDQSVFVKAGIPTVLLTSGITHDTNKPSDGPGTIDYNAMRYRCLSVARWINLKTRK